MKVSLNYHKEKGIKTNINAFTRSKLLKTYS